MRLLYTPAVLMALIGSSHGFVLRPSASSTMTSLQVASTTLPETRPLAPQTFAGMVENGMKERFGEEAALRVMESWRLLDMDYEHEEYLGPDGEDESSQCHQLAHSYVPGLRPQEFYDTSDHPWSSKLEKKYKELKREFTQVTSDMAKLQEEGNNIWAGALTEDASSYGEGWKTLVLMNRGIWDPVNVQLFPKTAKAVRDCKIPAVEVFFASMQPNTDIQPHTDFTNFVVTSHLALDIPESGNNKCRLTIGDETRQWINGEVMLFDTSIRHSAVNEADQTRYILMMRVWHPDLTQVERDALQFIYDCLALPDLVSDDAQDRAKAESQLKVMKEFPMIERASGGSGFGGGGKKKKKKGKGK